MITLLKHKLIRRPPLAVLRMFLLLCLLLPAGVNAADLLPPAGAIQLEQAQRDYVLGEVRKHGARGDQFQEYVRQCNDNGICRFTRPKNQRAVTCQTPYAPHIVIYPEQ